MWPVAPTPTSAGQSFARCISRAKPAFKSGLLAAVPEVISASAKYEGAMHSGTVHELDPKAFASAYTSDAQLRNTYTHRMVPAKSAGRGIYDEIILSAPDGICPLCGQRTVATLDHYLPKKHFPILSVDPLNLVPACSDCNHLKQDRVAMTAHDVPIHPYFDDLEGFTWLTAEIVETSPAAVVFRVDVVVAIDPVLEQRIRNHFKSLGLGKLYATHAAVELQDIRVSLTNAFERGEAGAVRVQLGDQIAGRRDRRRNSWQTAMYAALETSVWFCAGGFSADLGPAD